MDPLIKPANGPANGPTNLTPECRVPRSSLSTTPPVCQLPLLLPISPIQPSPSSFPFLRARKGRLLLSYSFYFPFITVVQGPLIEFAQSRERKKLQKKIIGPFPAINKHETFPPPPKYSGTCLNQASPSHSQSTHHTLYTTTTIFKPAFASPLILSTISHTYISTFALVIEFGIGIRVGIGIGREISTSTGLSFNTTLHRTHPHTCPIRFLQHQLSAGPLTSSKFS
jgi:hypothetical protein